MQDARRISRRRLIGAVGLAAGAVVASQTISTPTEAVILDAADPARTFSGGPVGMRLDYFNTEIAETCVYVS